jgi:hypothetical protein
VAHWTGAWRCGTSVADRARLEQRGIVGRGRPKLRRCAGESSASGRLQRHGTGDALRGCARRGGSVVLPRAASPVRLPVPHPSSCFRLGSAVQRPRRTRRALSVLRQSLRFVKPDRHQRVGFGFAREATARSVRQRRLRRMDSDSATAAEAAGAGVLLSGGSSSQGPSRRGGLHATVLGSSGR